MAKKTFKDYKTAHEETVKEIEELWNNKQKRRRKWNGLKTKQHK